MAFHQVHLNEKKNNAFEFGVQRNSAMKTVVNAKRIIMVLRMVLMRAPRASL